jgi:intracellular sulfur oxidation DsrE/DsrF family protein
LKATLSFGTDNSKDCGFFAARFFAVNRARTKLTDLLPSSFCSMVFANLTRYVKMSFTKVFFGGKAFKIVGSVVRLVAVNVVNLFKGVKALQPTSCNNSVHEALPAQHKVSLCVCMWSVGMQISKNFSAARNGVKMVKHTVLSAVHRKANHVVPLGDCKDFILPLK